MNNPLKIGVIGYGSQGAAQAENLKDSGLEVYLGLRENSPSTAKTQIPVLSIPELVQSVDLISLQTPDEVQPSVYHQSILPYLKPGQSLLFSHGYSIQYGLITPPETVDVLLVAPLGPGSLVRSSYQNGHGVSALYCVHQQYNSDALTRLMTYAQGTGATRAGLIQSTIKEETETDLFAEQAVLVGGVQGLVKASFETLVTAGYNPEVAYMVCLHELKQTVDLLQRDGFYGMNNKISNTAEYGSYLAEKVLIDDHFKQGLQQLLDSIQSGEFANTWNQTAADGAPELMFERAELTKLLIETVGNKLRPKLFRN
jgi:ketol-acid reductoisomerase